MPNNLNNLEFTRITTPVPNWIVKADITDEEGNVVADFGADGVDINSWWNTQTEEFQLDILAIFVAYIKESIAP
jgi:hypothetical protein